MTKPKHKYSKIFLSLIIPFFSLAFFNSSFFRIKEINYEGINQCIEKELKTSFDKLKEKNLLLLNSNQIRSYFASFPFIEVESFQKILPDKLSIKFKIKEELGTFMTNYGSYDIYEGGYLFPRFRETDEKVIVEGKILNDDLKFISEIISKNKFIYDYFLCIRVEDKESFDFLTKNGYWIKIPKDMSIDSLKKAIKIIDFCPLIFEKENVSMLNLNSFLASR